MSYHRNSGKPWTIGDIGRLAWLLCVERAPMVVAAMKLGRSQSAVRSFLSRAARRP